VPGAVTLFSVNPSGTSTTAFIGLVYASQDLCKGGVCNQLSGAGCSVIVCCPTGHLDFAGILPGVQSFMPNFRQDFFFHQSIHFSYPGSPSDLGRAWSDGHFIPA